MKAKSPKMSGEDLFQHARRLVIAEMQNIVFSEFLPITLGTLLHDLHLYYVNRDCGGRQTEIRQENEENIMKISETHFGQNLHITFTWNCT